MKSTLLAVFALALSVAVAPGCLMGPCGGVDWNVPRPTWTMSGDEIDFASSGPVPDMATARLVAKAQILSRMSDPTSIRIEWPTDFQREHEIPNDESGAVLVNWSLEVPVAAPRGSSGEESVTTWMFSFHRLALVKVVHEQRTWRYAPPLPLDDLAAQASQQGYALAPDEQPVVDSH